MKLGVPCEATLWRLTYTYPCTEEHAPTLVAPGTTGPHEHSGQAMFLTADPTGADAIEVAGKAGLKPLPDGFRVGSLERLADSVRGLALRLGDAATWPEPGDAGAAILQVTERQAAAEGAMRREIVHLRRSFELVRKACDAQLPTGTMGFGLAQLLRRGDVLGLSEAALLALAELIEHAQVARGFVRFEQESEATP